MYSLQGVLYYYMNRAAHLFNFICCIFVLFFFVLCHVPNVACESVLYLLDYPFVFFLTFVYSSLHIISGKIR